MRRLILFNPLPLSSILLLGIVTGAAATSYGPPREEVLKSPNGQYELRIDPKSRKHEIREGKKLLWSFEADVWQDAYYLSNDGRHVLWVAWKHVKAEDVNREAAILVYSSDGVVLKKAFAEVSEPRRRGPDEIGPIGDSWRIWRGKITRQGEIISIAVEGRNAAFKIDLTAIEKRREGEPEN